MRWRHPLGNGGRCFFTLVRSFLGFGVIQHFEDGLPLAFVKPWDWLVVGWGFFSWFFGRWLVRCLWYKGIRYASGCAGVPLVAFFPARGYVEVRLVGGRPCFGPLGGQVVFVGCGWFLLGWWVTVVSVGRWRLVFIFGGAIVFTEEVRAFAWPCVIVVFFGLLC